MRGKQSKLERSTVQGEYSLTSYHYWETVETIDRPTVRFRGPFLEFQKTVKNTDLHLYKKSGYNLF